MKQMRNQPDDSLSLGEQRQLGTEKRAVPHSSTDGLESSADRGPPCFTEQLVAKSFSIRLVPKLSRSASVFAAVHAWVDK